LSNFCDVADVFSSRCWPIWGWRVGWWGAWSCWHLRRLHAGKMWVSPYCVMFCYCALYVNCLLCILKVTVLMCTLMPLI